MMEAWTTKRLQRTLLKSFQVSVQPMRRCWNWLIVFMSVRGVSFFLNLQGSKRQTRRHGRGWTWVLGRRLSHRLPTTMSVYSIWCMGSPLFRWTMPGLAHMMATNMARKKRMSLLPDQCFWKWQSRDCSMTFWVDQDRTPMTSSFHAGHQVPAHRWIIAAMLPQFVRETMFVFVIVHITMLRLTKPSKQPPTTQPGFSYQWKMKNK
mmetsp:Transcript_30526/g.70378  ORF Transcript_30526/g.70378 Transcript_30526/m.70378 type:complete len:206 (-) Transcript_30526:221-838(-)